MQNVMVHWSAVYMHGKVWFNAARSCMWISKLLIEALQWNLYDKLPWIYDHDTAALKLLFTPGIIYKYLYDIKEEIYFIKRAVS